MLKMLSYQELDNAIRRAFVDSMPDGEMVGDLTVMPGHLIAQLAPDKFVRVDYVMDETTGDVTFAERKSWQPVTREFVASEADESAEDASTEETTEVDASVEYEDEDDEDTVKHDAALVAFGGALKALGDGKVGGYLVVFSDETSPDLDNDFFTKDTDFGIDDGSTLPVYYAHGTDPQIKRKRIGRGTAQKDDAGLWFETQLQLADEYERRIYELAEKGKLGYSSGAAAHLVERRLMGSAKQITQWVIAEASLTPQPAEPRTRGIVPIKSLLTNSIPPVEPDAPPDAPADAEPPALDAANAMVKTIPVIEVVKQEENIMSDQNAVNAAASPSDTMELKSIVKEQSEQIAKLLQAMEDTPSARKGGYYTVDGGTADATVKSLGDMLMAIKRNDEKRLVHVYGAVKTLTGENGSTGGYTLPTSFSTDLLNISPETSPILSRVNRIPVSGLSGEYPVLDIYTAPTAASGQDAKAGGLRGRVRAEGGAYTETEPKFEQITYRVSDSASGFVKVSRELSEDAPYIETILRNGIQRAVNSKMERDVISGTGVGEPLGILTNTAGLVDVTPATNSVFAYADATTMLSRYEPYLGRTVWLAHRSIIPDIYAFQTNTSGGTQAVTDVQNGNVGNVLGYPVVYSQHLPLADASGCVVLADLSAYLWFTRGELYIEYSEHADWLNGNGTWRFGIRCDGKPMNRGVITQSNPGTGHTVSHFVRFND